MLRSSIVLAAVAWCAAATVIRRDDAPSVPPSAGVAMTGTMTTIDLKDFALDGSRDVASSITLVTYLSSCASVAGSATTDSTAASVSYGAHEGDNQRLVGYNAPQQTLCLYGLGTAELAYLFFNPHGGQDLRKRLQSIDLFNEDVDPERCTTQKPAIWFGRDTGRNANDKDAFALPGDLHGKVVGIADKETNECKVLP